MLIDYSTMCLYLGNSCSDIFVPHEFLNFFENVLEIKTIEKVIADDDSQTSELVRSLCFGSLALVF